MSLLGRHRTGTDGTHDVAALAAHGSGPSSSLPFLDEIQTSFGTARDLSGVSAHTGATAGVQAKRAHDEMPSGDALMSAWLAPLPPDVKAEQVRRIAERVRAG